MMFKLNYQDYLFTFILLLIIHVSIVFGTSEESMDQINIVRHRAHQNSQIKSNKRTVINQSNGMVNTNGGDSYNLQRDYVATNVGKEVQLDCKMKDLISEDDKIVWLKMPKGEVLALNGNRVTSDPRITTKCVSSLTPCWSLVITNTRESDSGFYVCQTNAMQTKYVYLDIMVPPKLLTQYPVDRIDVNQSSNASITCEFYGKPEPLIKWYKYNNGVAKEIEKLRGLKTIHLFIHKESPSEFECVADNSIPPTVSKKIFLNIQYPPQIKFQNTKVFQKIGERVIFDCNVNSNPKAKIYWYKNQVRLHESNKYMMENLDNSYHRLYINNLTESDFTDYYCTAVNMLGKSTSKIELLELPSINTPQMMKTTTSTSTKPPITTTTTTISKTTAYILTNPTAGTPRNTTKLLDLINDTLRFNNPYLNKNIWPFANNNNNNKENNHLNEYYEIDSEDKSSSSSLNPFYYTTPNLNGNKQQKHGKIPSHRSNKFPHHNNQTKLTKNQRKLHHKQQLNHQNGIDNQIEPTTTTAFSILQFDNNRSNSYLKLNQVVPILIMTLANYFMYNMIYC